MGNRSQAGGVTQIAAKKAACFVIRAYGSRWNRPRKHNSGVVGGDPMRARPCEQETRLLFPRKGATIGRVATGRCVMSIRAKLGIVL